MTSVDAPITLPFDERNQQDFVQTTKRIQDALQKLSTDRRLKLTEANLARLADCSRGTLRNRKWPIQQLQVLKVAAKKLVEANILEGPEPRAARERSRVDRYREQLDMSRDELLIWKRRHDDLLAKVETIEAQRDTLKRRCEALEERLRGLASTGPKLLHAVPSAATSIEKTKE